eukprot:7087509-Ditylum_brightwellii.AAC.1
MREDGQLLSILLWLTCGLLELNKCSYCIIHFLLYPDSTPQMQLHQPNHSLHINKADTNENAQIQYKSVLNFLKTLGHYKAPAVTSRAQATVLADHDEQYERRVTKSSLTRHEA